MKRLRALTAAIMIGIGMFGTGLLFDGELAHASSAPGTAVSISGLDDISATVDTEARTGFGKALGIAIALAGLGGCAAGFVGPGAIAVAAGVATAFVPGLISTAHDAAPASALASIQYVSAYADAWYRPAMAALYGPLLALRAVIDPTIALPALVGLTGLRRLRRVKAA